MGYRDKEGGSVRDREGMSLCKWVGVRRTGGGLLGLLGVCGRLLGVCGGLLEIMCSSKILRNLC